MKFFYLFFSLMVITFQGFTQGKISRDEYINQYKSVAIRQMKAFGVPASIILAQGILESENGNSMLAVKANNHFGIKCHTSWQGPTIYHDDDKKGECFRKYSSPEKSYQDHSEFLRGSRRYAPLFDLQPTDYKSWAHGLKKAGYATNPQYAERLIKLIEENKLYQYDQGVEVEVESPTKGMGELVDVDNYTIDLFKQRKVFTRNRIKYIIVKEGDSFESIAKDLDLRQWQLFKYNDLPRESVLKPGTELYIQPKRCRAEVNHKWHVVEKGETMYTISQLYGIKMKSLYRKNRMKPGDEPEEGDKIYLRNRKPRD